MGRMRGAVYPVCGFPLGFVIYRVVDARNYVAPGADRPAAAARAPGRVYR